jgi:hypothetical protein
MTMTATARGAIRSHTGRSPAARTPIDDLIRKLRDRGMSVAGIARQCNVDPLQVCRVLDLPPAFARS